MKTRCFNRLYRRASYDHCRLGPGQMLLARTLVFLSTNRPSNHSPPPLSRQEERTSSQPTTVPLGPPRDRFGNLCEDPNRKNFKKLTCMCSREFFGLAELVRIYRRPPNDQPALAPDIATQGREARVKKPREADQPVAVRSRVALYCGRLLSSQARVKLLEAVVEPRGYQARTSCDRQGSGR